MKIIITSIIAFSIGAISGFAMSGVIKALFNKLLDKIKGI